MLLKKTPKIFLAVALQTKKFFFRSYMIESDRPYVNEVQKWVIWHTNIKVLTTKLLIHQVRYFRKTRMLIKKLDIKF